MRAVSVVLSTAHQDTGLVDYFNYRLAATAESSPAAAATSANSEHRRAPSAGHEKRSSTSRRAAAPRRGRSARVGQHLCSASASAASSSGSTSQPVSPASTMSAGPVRSTAIGGSRRPSPRRARAELLATDGEHERVGRAAEVGQLVVVVPAGQEDVVARPARARPRPRDARPPTRPGGRRRARARRAAARSASRAGEGADEQPDALDLGEAPDGEQHGIARPGPRRRRGG